MEKPQILQQLISCKNLLELLYYRYLCDRYAYGHRLEDSVREIADLLNSIEPGITQKLDTMAKYDMLNGSTTNE